LALTSVPAATITAPRPDTTLGGSSATITGTAGGPNFASYSVRYGLGLYPSNWTTIRSSRVPTGRYHKRWDWNRKERRFASPGSVSFQLLTS